MSEQISYPGMCNLCHRPQNKCRCFMREPVDLKDWTDKTFVNPCADASCVCKDSSKQDDPKEQPKRVCKGHGSWPAKENCDICQMLDQMSKPFPSKPKKIIKWDGFAAAMRTHIEEYVIRQYGDDGEDPATEYTAEYCVSQILKYATRYGKDTRPGQEYLNLFKMAHYAQMAYNRLNKEKNGG